MNFKVFVLLLFLITAHHSVLSQDTMIGSDTSNIDYEVKSNISEDSGILTFEVFATNNNEVSQTIGLGPGDCSIAIKAYTTPQRMGEPRWNGIPTSQYFINNLANPTTIRECNEVLILKKIEPQERLLLFTHRFNVNEIPLPDGRYFFSADLGKVMTLKEVSVLTIPTGDAYITTSEYVNSIPASKEHLGARYSASINRNESTIKLDLELNNINSSSLPNLRLPHTNTPSKECSIWLSVYKSEKALNRWLWDWYQSNEWWYRQCLVTELQSITRDAKEVRRTMSFTIDEPNWQKLQSKEAYFLVLFDNGTNQFVEPVIISAGKLEKK